MRFHWLWHVAPLLGLAAAVGWNIWSREDRRVHGYYLGTTGGYGLTVCLAEFERVDPNRLDRHGITPLFAATFDGNLAAVESLIERGADPAASIRPADGYQLRFFRGKNGFDDIEPAGWTALHLAAYLGRKEFVERLLAAGADINARTDAGQTPIAVTLLDESNGRTSDCVFVDEMIDLLAKAGGDVNLADANGRTPLDVAVHDHDQGAVYLVKKLVAVGARPDYHSAAMTGDTALVERRLDEGADVNWKWPNGKTPLHFAAYHGYEKLVELLLRRGADVNAKTRFDRTPLHDAALGENVEIVRMLLRAGADVHVRSEYWKLTPLHEAASGNNVDIVQALLAAGADPNARDCSGDPPLKFATWFGKVEPHQAAVAAALRAAGGKTEAELDAARK